VRPIHKTYDDPLSLIWLHAAAQMGMRVERSPEVNASWNGAGVLTIGTPESLDPDDSLAQMILHETCHALVEGPASLGQLDWGLPNAGVNNRIHEHACLRLQAALADQVGLRQFFAATTMFRTYYDHLPTDPLLPGDDPAIILAQTGWERAKHGSWSDALDDALRRTAEIARVLRGVTGEGTLWHGAGA
jgi:hypothetical protein